MSFPSYPQTLSQWVPSPASNLSLRIEWSLLQGVEYHDEAMRVNVRHPRAHGFSPCGFPDGMRNVRCPAGIPWLVRGDSDVIFP